MAKIATLCTRAKQGRRGQVSRRAVLLAPDAIESRGVGLWEAKQGCDPWTRRVPVIACTAAAHLTNEIQAKPTEHDCALVGKPFDLKDLLAEIRRRLEACVLEQRAT